MNPLLDPEARLVIAHRGNRVAAPENTILALEQAIALGADAVEFDVRASRDGVPVLMHDATVDRTTSGTGRVDAQEASALRTLDAGRARPGQSGARVPTLEEVMERLPAAFMVIEIKDVRSLEPTTRLVRRFGASGRVVLGSAEHDVMSRLYETRLATCASMLDALRLVPYALAGSAPPPPRFQVLSLTPIHGGIPIPVVRLARAARRIGIPTQAWTVNAPDVARRYWNGGVAGIISDDPAGMLRERAQSFGHGA